MFILSAWVLMVAGLLLLLELVVVLVEHAPSSLFEMAACNY